MGELVLLADEERTVTEERVDTTTGEAQTATYKIKDLLDQHQVKHTPMTESLKKRLLTRICGWTEGVSVS